MVFKLVAHYMEAFGYRESPVGYIILNNTEVMVVDVFRLCRS